MSETPDKKAEEALENREQFSIMFEDLNPKTQQALLNFMQVNDPKQLNWDTEPITIIYGDEKEEVED